MRPSLTVPPVPQRLSRAASSRTLSSESGRSNTVVTPLPRRPAVSLPTFKVTGFFAGSFTGGDAGSAASVGLLSWRWPPPRMRATRPMTSRSIRPSTAGASSTCQNSTFSAQAGKRSCSSGRCSACFSATTNAAPSRSSPVTCAGIRVMASPARTPSASSALTASTAIGPTLVTPRSRASPLDDACQAIPILPATELNRTSANRLR